MNRKGVYTELADWARPRGYTHLRVDGNFLPTTGFPRIDRFKEHTIELPVASLDVSPENEAQLRHSAGRPRWTHGKGVVHVLSGIDTPGGSHGGRLAHSGHRPSAGVLDQACLPRVQPRVMPNWTRASSATTASTAGAPTAWARA